VLIFYHPNPPTFRTGLPLPSHHSYDFHRLPDRIKRQLARAIADAGNHLREEIPGNVLFYVLRGIGLFLVAGWGLMLLADNFGNPAKDELWTDQGLMIGMALFTGALAYLTLVVRRRYVLNKAFNFQPGQYLFPFTMIDARSTRLTVIDFTQVLSIQAVDHNVNGSYSHTTFTFSFPDAQARSWKVASKTRADQFGAKLAVLQQAVHSAAERKDIATLMRLDPFYEIRMKNWAVPDTGPAPATGRVRALLAHPVAAKPIVAALVLAAVLAPVLWVARNTAADFAVRAEAQRLKTETAYTEYIVNGWFHVDDMRAALPRVALDEVLKKNSVTALRDLAARYPEAGLKADIDQAIHVLYQRALARFTRQATTSDPALLATMEQLLLVLEQSGKPQVAIQFTRPTDLQLGELDASIKQREKEVGSKIIPASIHFGNDSAAPREARIAKGLQAAFRTIFTNDVLDLVVMRPNTKHMPRLAIAYQIAPSGAVYFSEKEKERAFVGLVARFQSQLEVGPAVDPWRFDMAVLPPEHFTVNFDLPPGAVNAGPRDSQVYAVMAERAFDELAVKIRAAFFRRDSAAFKR
jgi:hypothetical protein